MAQWLTAEVIENKPWHNDLFSLRLKTPPFEFIAGQFVRLGLPNAEGGRIQRAYSLVNSPTDPIADFVVTRVPDGLLSPRLHALQPGDSIEVSQPASGFFTLQEVPPGDNLWLIATGTGIGPYLSMLDTDLPWQRFSKIVLVHGVRTAADLCYQERIGTWSQRYPQQFHYQPVVSREAVTGALTGRIPSLIANGKLEHHSQLPLTTASQVMLCGNPAMIVDAKEQLALKGLNKNLRREPGNVTVEQYWKS